MIAFHAATALAAISVGVAVAVARKGTATHRRLGWLYVALVGLMAVSSFGIYQLRDGPSVFHAVSVVVLGVLAAGLTQPLRRRRRPTWRYWHAILMPASLLMIATTGIVQFFDRLPFASDALNAIVFLQLPAIVGFLLIMRAARHVTRPASTRRPPGS